jgi:hypothetical protein
MESLRGGDTFRQLQPRQKESTCQGRYFPSSARTTRREHSAKRTEDYGDNGKNQGTSGETDKSVGGKLFVAPGESTVAFFATTAATGKTFNIRHFKEEHGGITICDILADFKFRKFLSICPKIRLIEMETLLGR